jgi:hypothetical protein
MSGHVRWAEVRAGFIAYAGGPEVFGAGKQELMAQVIGARLSDHGPDHDHRATKPDPLLKAKSQVAEGALIPAWIEPADFVLVGLRTSPTMQTGPCQGKSAGQRLVESDERWPGAGSNRRPSDFQ